MFSRFRPLRKRNTCEIVELLRPENPGEGEADVLDAHVDGEELAQGGQRREGRGQRGDHLDGDGQLDFRVFS